MFCILHLDTEPPILKCFNDTMIAVSVSYANYANVRWNFIELSDNSGQIVSFTCNPGSPYRIGTTVHTCTAIDDAGNEASCDTTIEVLGKFILCAGIINLILY